MSSTWARYVGLDGVALGIDRFGMSAPGATVMKELGMTAEHVLEAAKTLPKADYGPPEGRSRRAHTARRLDRSPSRSSRGSRG